MKNDKTSLTLLREAEELAGLQPELALDPEAAQAGLERIAGLLREHNLIEQQKYPGGIDEWRARRVALYEELTVAQDAASETRSRHRTAVSRAREIDARRDAADEVRAIAAELQEIDKGILERVAERQRAQTVAAAVRADREALQSKHEREEQEAEEAAFAAAEAELAGRLKGEKPKAQPAQRTARSDTQQQIAQLTRTLNAAHAREQRAGEAISALQAPVKELQQRWKVARLRLAQIAVDDALVNVRPAVIELYAAEREAGIYRAKPLEVTATEGEVEAAKERIETELPNVKKVEVKALDAPTPMHDEDDAGDADTEQGQDEQFERDGTDG